MFNIENRIRGKQIRHKKKVELATKTNGSDMRFPKDEKKEEEEKAKSQNSFHSKLNLNPLC